MFLFFGQLQSKAEVLDKYNPLTYHLLKYFSFFVDLGNFLNQPKHRKRKIISL